MPFEQEIFGRKSGMLFTTAMKSLGNGTPESAGAGRAILKPTVKIALEAAVADQ